MRRILASLVLVALAACGSVVEGTGPLPPSTTIAGSPIPGAGAPTGAEGGPAPGLVPIESTGTTGSLPPTTAPPTTRAPVPVTTMPAAVAQYPVNLQPEWAQTPEFCDTGILVSEYGQRLYRLGPDAAYPQLTLAFDNVLLAVDRAVAIAPEDVEDVAHELQDLYAAVAEQVESATTTEEFIAGLDQGRRLHGGAIGAGLSRMSEWCGWERDFPVVPEA